MCAVSWQRRREWKTDSDETGIKTFCSTIFSGRHPVEVRRSVLRPAGHFARQGFPFQGDLMAKRTLHPNLRIFDSDIPDKLTVNFTAFPTWFFDDLIRLGKGIPASFWKFTFALMRQVLSAVEKNGEVFTNTYTWNSTFEDFKEKHDLGDLAVQDWTNAYSCSGLFSIVKGKRKFPKDPNGTPTVWTYNRNATRRDWLAFVIALSKTLNPADGKRMARHGWVDDVDASHAYKLMLSLEVDKARAGSVGLPPLPAINEKRIEIFLERGYGKRESDGSISWTYKKPKAIPNPNDERRYGN